MSTARLIAIAAAALLAASVASAQSLGDVAKKEQARRKDVRTPGKVYTNGDLHVDSGSTPPPAPAPQAGASTGVEQVPPSPSGVQGKEPEKPAEDDAKKAEGYWKDRITKARGDLDRSKTFADALQSRINALTADFANRDDPAQRNQISGDRQKALAELDRVKKEIEANTKAIADIQEEARKAGVPAGWVR